MSRFVPRSKSTVFGTSPDGFPLLLQILYYYAMVYNFAITMTKIAILLFYDRIFVTRVFHVAVWAVATFTVLMSSSAFIVLIFPCQPIRFFWDKDLAVGHCLNYEAFITAEAALTIFLDIVILTMPMPLVWNLKVSRRQKATLSGIFLLGGFVCIASIMRLPTLHDIFTVDYTWNVCGASEWSLIEANLGVVCACLPLLRPFVVRFLRTSGATRQTSPSKFNSKSFLSLSTWSSKAGARNTLSSQPTDSNEAESGTFQRLDTPKELELRLDRIPREAGRITAPGKGFFDSEETAISEGFTPRSEEILRFHGQPLDDLPPVTNGV